jgi:hypothetical protein
MTGMQKLLKLTLIFLPLSATLTIAWVGSGGVMEILFFNVIVYCDIHDIFVYLDTLDKKIYISYIYGP